MTAAASDPAIMIASAGHQFFAALRELVERGEPTDVPGLLDEVTAHLRSARAKVNRATKRATEPAASPAPSTPAEPARKPAAEQSPKPLAPAVEATTTPAADRRAVTLSIPHTFRTQRTPAERGTPTATATLRGAEPRRRQGALAWIVGLLVALLMVLRGEPSAADAVPAGDPAVTVLERSCLYPDDAELDTPWIAEGPGGLRVELWCGTRLEVSGEVCRVRLGAKLSEVPCVDGSPRTRSTR